MTRPKLDPVTCFSSGMYHSSTHLEDLKEALENFNRNNCCQQDSSLFGIAEHLYRETIIIIIIIRGRRVIGSFGIAFRRDQDRFQHPGVLTELFAASLLSHEAKLIPGWYLQSWPSSTSFLISHNLSLTMTIDA